MKISTATTPTSEPLFRSTQNHSPSLGHDEFLTLFIATMRNQDPLNPMEATDMTAQLAQFSSLEQLTNLNKAFSVLQDMTARSEHLAQTSLSVSMIGKRVVALGNALKVDDDGQLSVRFYVGAGGGEATLRIFDKQGNEVAAYDLGLVSEGEQTFDLSGKKLEPGVYSYRVEVVRDGATVPVQEYTVAKVDAVHFDATGVLLSSGASFFIPLSDVLSISE